VGSAIAAFIAYILPAAPEISTAANVMNAIAEGVISGVAFALVQWLILYRYLPGLNGRQWLGANVLGYLFSYLIYGLWAIVGPYIQGSTRYNPTDALIESILYLLIAPGLGGAVIALVQWQVLGDYLKQWQWWIGASITGWIVMGWAAPAIHTYMDPPWLACCVLPPAEQLSRATGLPGGLFTAVAVALGTGFLLGAITGLALAALVRARSEATP
jgi:hypothetical protein